MFEFIEGLWLYLVTASFGGFVVYTTSTYSANFPHLPTPIREPAKLSRLLGTTEGCS